MSQEKFQTMVMQKFWGVIEVYYGIVQEVNSFIHCKLFYDFYSKWHCHGCACARKGADNMEAAIACRILNTQLTNSDSIPSRKQSRAVEIPIQHE